MNFGVRIEITAVVALALVAAGGAAGGDPSSSSAPSTVTVDFAGGSLRVERGECDAFDAGVIREWADRAYADLSAAWPDRAALFRAEGLRLSGRRDPASGGKPAYGYWDRERATIVFRCGTEPVVRHELFHVWCERARLPCDCERIDHPGGFDLACRPLAADRLEQALARLAARAQLHRTFLYRIQCDEAITRVVNRSRNSAATFGLQPGQMREQRNGILVVKQGTGAPAEKRLRLDGEGHVRMTKKGKPVEARLPPEFDPVARAFPHAQVAWFTAADQQRLAFRLLEGGPSEAGEFRIVCPESDDLAIQFLDRQAPRREGPRSAPRCAARASGQMCLEPNGEVRRVQFFGTYFDGEACRWDKSAPFATIEQDVVEKTEGLRFPSRVTTVVPLDWRDTAIFVQTYENCVFADVRVETDLDP